jgi:hypothetical protein
MESSDIAFVPTPQHPAAKHEFAMCFTFTPRGARLARRLVSYRLDQ